MTEPVLCENVAHAYLSLSILKLLSSQVDIRDATRPEQKWPPLDDHAEGNAWSVPLPEKSQWD